MTSKQVKILNLFLLSLFGIYVLLRGILIPMTIDECVTFHHFRSSPWSDVFNFIPPTANNHVINTMWVKLMAMNFNYQEWVLRLPNLLSFGLYVYFGWKIIDETLENKWLVLCGSLVLVANPYMIEFFSLARGYGLGLSFMMCSLYFLLKSHKNSEKNLHFALFFAILSVLSNFSMLNFYLGLIAALGLSLLYEKKWKSIFYLFLWTICLGWLIFNPISKMKKAGELYYGGENGFFQDTVLSLVQDSFFTENIENGWILAIVIIVLLFLNITNPTGFKNLSGSLYLKIVIILLICILSPIIQFHLLGNKFLIHRTALLYYPLVILALFLNENRKIQPILIIFSVFLGFNFAKNANLSEVREWDFDKYSKNVIEYLAKNDGADKKLRLAAHPLFVQSLNFYVIQQKIDWIERVPDEPVQNHPDFDYFYIQNEHRNQVPENAKIVAEFENGKYLLLVHTHGRVYQ